MGRLLPSVEQLPHFIIDCFETQEAGNGSVDRRALSRGLRQADTRNANLKKESKMLETIAVVLVILWVLGFVTSYTMGGLIHILLVIAVVVILVRVIQGRRL